jgi:Putative zinc-finger
VNELDLRCTTVAELATQYLEQELSAAQQTSYETHLLICDNCMVYLQDIRELVASLGTLPADPVDPAERQRILDLVAR